MPTLSASQLRPRLAEALRAAESGERVVITRHGKPAAALLSAEQLARLEQQAPGEAPPGDGGDGVVATAGESAPEQLLARAAAPSLQRIARDLERLPEQLKPVLGMIRENLFRPRLTVRRIKQVLGVGANDLTTRFRRAAGAPIRDYLEDRRLESASRLLVDTGLDLEKIARLVGYRSREVFARAFKRRYGVRPPVFREFEGRLSREAAAGAAAGRAPVVPRYLAGVVAAAPDAACARCGGALAPQEALRVFEDSAPICDACARARAPALAALLGIG